MSLERTRKKVARGLDALSACFAIIAIPSFALFFMFSWWAGGDAFNSISTEGRYFVSSHGNFTEVSWLTYTVSWYLGALTLATFFPMALLGLASRYLDKEGNKRD